jgi:leader peptidase (prepilin peptidase)/N-methyltransferase
MSETLEALPRAFPVGVSLVLGLMIGSFLNVVAYRLPRGESLSRPGSRCPACKTPIAPRDNVPVLSYCWLRGRCRHCAAPIPPRYALVELATGLLFAAIAWRYGATLMTPVWFAFAAALVAAALIDHDHRVIPDEISVGGLVLALLLVPAVHAAMGGSFGAALLRGVGGALLGGGLLWVVGFAHARLSVAAGRSFPHWPGEGEALPRPGSLDYWTWFPGLGFGDVKLLAMIGAVLGPVGVLETIFAASLVGLVIGLAYAATTRAWTAPFGFGPAIALGALAVLLSPVGIMDLLGP